MRPPNRALTCSLHLLNEAIKTIGVLILTPLIISFVIDAFEKTIATIRRERKEDKVRRGLEILPTPTSSVNQRSFHSSTLHKRSDPLMIPVDKRDVMGPNLNIDGARVVMLTVSCSLPTLRASCPAGGQEICCIRPIAKRGLTMVRTVSIGA